MKRTTSVQLVAILAAVIGAAGCGGDAGVSVTGPTNPTGTNQVHGTVRMPNGKVALGPTSSLERFAARLLPAADAISANNVIPVGAGVQVTLVLLHSDGSQDAPAATALTDSSGAFTMNLPGQTNADTCRYIVEVGSGESLTRAFVTVTNPINNDIDYATEAEVRLLLNNVSQGDNLCNYTSAQLNNSLLRIRNMPGVATGSNAAEVNESAYEIAASASPPIFPPLFTPTTRPTNTAGRTSTPTIVPPATATHTAAPPTSTFTSPPPPTSTATPIPQPPCTPPAISVELQAATPGTQVTIHTTLHTGGASVAGTQNDITFAPETQIEAKSNGKPNCTVNAAIMKDATSFAFRPPGCTVGTCTSVRALVVATDNTDPIADGSLLYTCVVDVASSANTTYTLAVSGVVLSDPNGGKVPNATGCSGGIIAGLGPTPTVSGVVNTPTTVPTSTFTPTFTPTTAPSDTPVPTVAADPTPTTQPSLTFTPTNTPSSVPTTPTGPTATATQTPPPSSTPTPGPPTNTPGSMTPTFVPRTCKLGGSTGALLSSSLISLGLPLSGTQTWRFGPVQSDSTRQILILPDESHFDCAGTSFAGQQVKICARLDATNYCQGGANDGKACPPADCGGNPCGPNPGRGTLDCAPTGGNITAYDSLVAIDHDTNNVKVGGQPNTGFPSDPTCVGTFLTPDGQVQHSCIEPPNTATPLPGPGTPTATLKPTTTPGTPTPPPTPTARAAAAATCSGDMHLGTHGNVCNSPTVQTFSGSSVAGGFRLHEAIDLSFSIGASCSTMSCSCDTSAADTNGNTCTSSSECGNGVCSVCPPDTCPAQGGDLQIAGDITSGLARGIIWNVNNGASIMGTTGTGNGANVCGGPCKTIVNGQPIDLTSVGGNCLGDPANLPASINGATLGLAYPAIDFPTVGDFIATLTLQCAP